MNDVRKEELIRLSMQRELTAEEESTLESWFAAHPEARSQWEQERALSRAIRALPDVPVSTNFTSRVLQAVNAEEAAKTRKEQSSRKWSRFLLPRAGWAMAMAAIIFVGVRFFSPEPKDMGDVLVNLPVDFAKIPAPDVLADFDAINQLRQASVMTSDDRLLEALQ